MCSINTGLHRLSRLDFLKMPHDYFGTYVDRKFLDFFRSFHEDGRSEAHERLREVDDFLPLLVNGDGCGSQVSRLLIISVEDVAQAMNYND